MSPVIFGRLHQDQIARSNQPNCSIRLPGVAYGEDWWVGFAIRGE